ncbi:MAG TPA: cell wall hydrolase [Methylococcaceae bacterium]|nr:cell wall hydrolase [Methylococcaceae bacterium]
MSREERKSNIPADEVDEKIADFEFSGAISVTKVRQPDGRFTIVAQFEETPAPPPATSSQAVPAGGTMRSSAEPRGMDIDTLARTVWGEARGEGREGREAVASVVLNRLKNPARFGNSIEKICLQPFQFSCWNANDPNRPQLENADASDPVFAECLAIAQAAAQGRLADSVLGADHYHTDGVSPDWSRGKVPCVTIGSHLFYNDIA